MYVETDGGQGFLLFLLPITTHVLRSGTDWYWYLIEMRVIIAYYSKHCLERNMCIAGMYR